MQKKLFKIVATGPESTGKSDLCNAIATHYNETFVPEFAREFLNQIKRKYSYNDLLCIAIGQLNSEMQESAKAAKFLICDTDLLTVEVWSQYVFGKVHPYISETNKRRTYDLYLLCNIDLAWVNDPLREHPHARKELFSIYLEKLKSYGKNYRIISGFEQERVNNAIQAIESEIKA